MNKQKLILITGGNRGIGLEVCRQLANMGHLVLLGSRNTMKGEKAIQGMKGEILVRKLDVTNLMEVRQLAETTEEEFGHLDVLINNAAILNGTEGVGQSDPETSRQVMDTNFLGPWNMIHYFLPLLKKSSDPRIINISSGMGAWADLTGGYAPYRLSKTGLNALTVMLANELAGNVKVNAMCPGWVRTDMGGASATRNVAEGADTAVWLSTSEHIPHGKFIRDRKVIEW